MSTQTQPQARLRSSIANVALAVEDRVVFGGADALRAVADVVKWPFERIAWAVERGVIWPLEERTGDLSGPLRAAGVALVAVAAIGAGVAGLLWAAPNNDESTVARQAIASPKPVATQPAPDTKAAPVLHGAAPDFKPETDDGASKAAGAAAGAGATTVPATAAAAGSGASPSSTSPAVPTAPAGPAAIKVARRFADAFVLYEIGQKSAEARAIFHETATPQLAKSLLRRPPRLPANVKVPKAKVVNVVAGPRRGATLTVSASLLRVGVTSELRIDLQKSKNGPRVTNVLG
jgi:hypothetical protein